MAEQSVTSQQLPVIGRHRKDAPAAVQRFKISEQIRYHGIQIQHRVAISVLLKFRPFFRGRRENGKFSFSVAVVFFIRRVSVAKIQNDKMLSLPQIALFQQIKQTIFMFVQTAVVNIFTCHDIVDKMRSDFMRLLGVLNGNKMSGISRLFGQTE